MFHPLKEMISYRWISSLWSCWWRCQQFALNMRNTARISLVHAPSYWCSACVSQCVWSFFSALDQWKSLLHFYFTPNNCGWIKCKSKFPKNTLQPHTLCSCIHCSPVLGPSWWNGYSVDPGGSKKEKLLKSSNLSKTSTRSKGSSRRFQWRSFHLKRTPYEKIIAFYSMRSTGKFGKMEVVKFSYAKLYH